MAQKNNKRKKAQVKKQVTKVVQPAEVTTVASGPSLVASSATFTAKARPNTVVDDLLQVRRADIAKIGFLLGIIIIVLIAAVIVNSQSTVFEVAGTKLSHAMRLQ